MVRKPLAKGDCFKPTNANLRVIGGFLAGFLPPETGPEFRGYLARATLETLLELGAVPVVNENDTVATEEIRYGDNDRLAARVAQMISADALVLLSDIDGLYTADPRGNPGAEHVPEVRAIDARIEAMAGGVNTQARVGSGGMRTKIEAAKIATTAGVHMAIADGRIEHPLKRIAEGGRCTWFLTPSNPVTSRKKWIAGSLEPRGALHVDAGAARAVHAGKSLLPAGVTRIEGDFARGDSVLIRDADGGEIGRGLVAYDSAQAARIIGRKSQEIEEVLGVAGRAELIHRDDMALVGE